jgi:peptide/nickel transport system permease protein
MTDSLSAASAPSVPPRDEQPVAESPTRRVIRRFRHNVPAMIGLTIVVLLILVAIFAPLLAPQSYTATVADKYQGPSTAHWLGTDGSGRDIASRLIYGARASLFVAFLVVLFALIAVIPLGLIAGYFGGWVDSIIMRFMDGLFTLPPLTLALAVAALLGASLRNAAIAISIAFVPGFVRLLRALVLAIREETFVEASRSVGVNSRRMMRKHIFPNVVSPLIVQIALALGYAIGAEAGLSFLGFGLQPPNASWGTMLQDGYNAINDTTWPLIPPGVAVLLAVLAFNLVGDGLRDALGRESFMIKAER